MIFIIFSSLVNRTHIAQVASTIDVALDSTIAHREFGIPTHASGFCKRIKPTATTKGTAINRTILDLYIGIMIHKAALAATKD